MIYLDFFWHNRYDKGWIAPHVLRNIIIIVVSEKNIQYVRHNFCTRCHKPQIKQVHYDKTKILKQTNMFFLMLYKVIKPNFKIILNAYRNGTLHRDVGIQSGYVGYFVWKCTFQKTWTLYSNWVWFHFLQWR